MKAPYLKCMLPLWLLAGAAAAQTEPLPPAPAAARPAESGAATRQWLDTQRQGRQAAATAQPLSGPVQEQIYERYRKSFSREIPDDFKRERIGNGSR